MNQPFGKYTLVSRLGSGGMAEVFRAVLTGPSGFEKQLALKVILPGFSSDLEFVRMFTHEATLAAQLDHANIVKIYDFDVVDGRHYIAMELVDGRDLRSVLRRCSDLETRLSVEEVALIGLEVCKGLSFAHSELTSSQGKVVIHRDVSPHNIMLSRAGEVKITDFGIAKVENSVKVTQTGTVKGKFAYMSPEQARAEQLDRRSDVFSLGCVLWELLNQRRLFSGSSDIDTLNNLQHAVIEPPSKNNPDVPPQMDQIILGALERDRERRTPSASVLGRQLEQVLEGFHGLDRTKVLPGLFVRLFGDEPIGGGGTAKLILDETADHEAEKPVTVAAIPGVMAASRAEHAGEVSKASTDPSVSLGSIEVDVEQAMGGRKRRFVLAGLGVLGLVAVAVIAFALGSRHEAEAGRNDAGPGDETASQVSNQGVKESVVTRSQGGPAQGSTVDAGSDSSPKAAQAGGTEQENAAKGDAEVSKPRHRKPRTRTGKKRPRPVAKGKGEQARAGRIQGRYAKNAALGTIGNPGSQHSRRVPAHGAGFYKAGVTMTAKDDHPTLTSGTVVKAKLTKDLRSDSESIITARVSREVRSSDGKLLLATGALLKGTWRTKGQTFVVDFTSAASDDRKISFAGKATIPGKRVKDEKAEVGWLLEVGAGTVFDVRVR